MVICGQAVTAQDISQKIPQLTIITHARVIPFSILPGWKKDPAIPFQKVNDKRPGQVAEKVSNHAVTLNVSNNFYTEQFGFFCKKELQLEKTIRMPVRFRLGSLEYCDYLENKSGWGLK